MTEQTGGCACGASRYRVTAAPLIVHACHCRKLPWIQLPLGARAYDTMYRLRDVWSDESLARIKLSIAEKQHAQQRG